MNDIINIFICTCENLLLLLQLKLELKVSKTDDLGLGVVGVSLGGRGLQQLIESALFYNGFAGVRLAHVVQQ